MDSGTNSLISSDARKMVMDILERSTELGQAEIQQVIRDIERAVMLAIAIDLPDSPSGPRKELKNLQSGIRRLINSISGVSDHAAFAMWDAARDQAGDPQLANFDSDGKFGSELAKLRRQAEFVDKAARLAYQQITVPRGAPPNIQARHFAFHVAVALSENGIEPKTTRNGVYYEILAELFSELMPTEDGEAFQRYGYWALNTSTLEETFVQPEYLRNSKSISE